MPFEPAICKDENSPMVQKYQKEKKDMKNEFFDKESLITVEINN